LVEIKKKLFNQFFLRAGPIGIQKGSFQEPELILGGDM
jgi:hypothetical protein